MTGVLLKLSVELEKGVRTLDTHRQSTMDSCIIIHSLESEGDVFHHAALDSLFANEQNALTIIKYKELYEKLERAMDRCEDVSNVLEAIVLKNS
jgi:uncharacterized protein Yka (UPF0111/DUF47 family)